ncbi:hypothetical protein NA56DRAFT_752632 [Hyaloscypha hepaticicola]|uniref:C2H2-type domain-containing protein n=1 Tax=Hyaloscypha hepaticicola TaxID=2082293 RepID=A0A2J6PSI0_9HELO|nr:hypothetical protein NA56DRAFT_752632 [Hyaloscypha hepaticicola]
MATNDREHAHPACARPDLPFAQIDGVHDHQARFCTFGLSTPSSTIQLLYPPRFDAWLSDVGCVPTSNGFLVPSRLATATNDWHPQQDFAQPSNNFADFDFGSENIVPCYFASPLSSASGQTIASDSPFPPSATATGDFQQDFAQPINNFADFDFGSENTVPCYFASPLSSASSQTIASDSPFPPSATAPSECGWKRCSSNLSCSTSKYRAHLKFHAEEARKQWKGARANGEMKCTWSGCKGKGKYPTEKLFEQHLINIHINPLVCTVKNCSHTKPFRARHDLQRHIDTAHSGTSKYRCPFDFCTKGFTRKDKWSKHLYDHHDTEPCPYSHCPDENFVAGVEQSTAEHIAKMHGIFECGLDGCNDGRVFGFSDTGLSEHLQVVHNMEWVTVLRARASAKSKGDSTLQIDHIS